MILRLHKVVDIIMECRRTYNLASLSKKYIMFLKTHLISRSTPDITYCSNFDFMIFFLKKQTQWNKNNLSTNYTSSANNNGNKGSSISSPLHKVIVFLSFHSISFLIIIKIYKLPFFYMIIFAGFEEER